MSRNFIVGLAIAVVASLVWIGVSGLLPDPQEDVATSGAGDASGTIAAETEDSAVGLPETTESPEVDAADAPVADNADAGAASTDTADTDTAGTTADVAPDPAPTPAAPADAGIDTPAEPEQETGGADTTGAATPAETADAAPADVTPEDVTQGDAPEETAAVDPVTPAAGYSTRGSPDGSGVADVADRGRVRCRCAGDLCRRIGYIRAGTHGLEDDHRSGCRESGTDPAGD